MSDFVPWFRGLAEHGGKGVVNNIDARCLGRAADQIESLRERLEFAEFEWNRATDGMKERDATIESLRAQLAIAQEVNRQYYDDAEHDNRIIDELRAQLAGHKTAS